MYHSGQYVRWNNHPAQIISIDEQEVCIRVWSLKDFKPFEVPKHDLYIIQKNHIQGLWKLQELHIGQPILYHGHLATVRDIPDGSSWVYAINLNGQRVVATRFQLETIKY